jgi:hypothetical protein
MKVPIWLLAARTRKKNARQLEGFRFNFRSMPNGRRMGGDLTIGSGSELAGVIKEEAQNQDLADA